MGRNCIFLIKVGRNGKNMECMGRNEKDYEKDENVDIIFCHGVKTNRKKMIFSFEK